MFGLLRVRRLTPSAMEMRDRVREEGAALPDFSVPAAHHEVALSPELIKAAKSLYEEATRKRAANGARNGDTLETVAQDRAEAEERAEAEGRRFLSLNF